MTINKVDYWVNVSIGNVKVDWKSFAKYADINRKVNSSAECSLNSKMRSICKLLTILFGIMPILK